MEWKLHIWNILFGILWKPPFHFCHSFDELGFFVDSASDLHFSSFRVRTRVASSDVTTHWRMTNTDWNQSSFEETALFLLQSLSEHIVKDCSFSYTSKGEVLLLLRIEKTIEQQGIWDTLLFIISLLFGLHCWALYYTLRVSGSLSSVNLQGWLIFSTLEM